MKPLVLPEALAGHWTDCLILTYGAELTFFEHYLWRQFPASCRRKVILMDGRQYRAACETLADRRLLRYVNQRYVVGGVEHHLVAHAKVILLTAEDRGRLLVGSGNLGMQGYASGGELFTTYDFSPDAADAAPAFHAVRELLEHMVSADLVIAPVQTYLWQVLDSAPWLRGLGRSGLGPVRHNLEESFLTQVEREVAGEGVEELWVMSPFFDERVEALRQLLRLLAPRSVRVLLQRNASVDGSGLARVLREHGGDSEVLLVRRTAIGASDVGYLHAKLLLLKLAERAVCLQGSANLSQAAMLLPASTGNIELCNLHSGARDEFDHLVNEVLIGEFPDWHERLAFRQDAPEDERRTRDDAFLVVGAELSANTISIHANRSLAAAEPSYVEVDEPYLPSSILGPLAWDDTVPVATLALTDEQTALFSRPVAVRVLWSEASKRLRSNPMYVVCRDLLDNEFRLRSHLDRFRGVTDLDVDDKELEELVRWLGETLVLGREDLRTSWRSPGRDVPANSTEEGSQGSASLRYEDVDYEAVRSHPRVRQYLSRAGLRSHDQTPIEVLMASVLGHVQAMSGRVVATHSTIGSAESVAFGSGADDDDELAEAEIHVARSRSRGRRIRDAFKRLVRRYLDGVESSRFRELIGPVVMTKNYVFFTHLLLELAKKEWFEEELEFVLDAFVRLWRAFWGTQGVQGYFAALPTDGQDEVRSQLLATKGNTLLLGAMTRMSQVTKVPSRVARRFELRNVWRNLLELVPDALDEATVAEASPMSGAFQVKEPTPFPAYDELEALATFQTEEGLERAIEERLGLPTWSCTVSRSYREPPSTAVEVREIGGDRDSVDVAKDVVMELLAHREMLHDRSIRYLVTMVRRGDRSEAGRFVYSFGSGSQGQAMFLASLDATPEVVPGRLMPEEPRWARNLFHLQDAITA